MEIIILSEKMPMDEVRSFARHWYEGLIKGTVDVERRLVALGGEYHIESCDILVQDGSKHGNVWGFNIRFEEDQNGILEFDSMVNIKPSIGNKSRAILDEEVVCIAKGIISSWIIFPKV